MHFLSPTLKKEKDKCANPLKRPRHWFRKNQVHHCTTERFYGTLNMASVARKKTLLPLSKKWSEHKKPATNCKTK